MHVVSMHEHIYIHMTSVGLSLGKQGRTLPTRIEEECLSFLSVPDIGSVYLVSHAMSESVVHLYRRLETLKFDVGPIVALGRWLTPKAKFSAYLPVRFCRSLRTIVVPCDATCLRGGTNHEAATNWLAALIQKNASTLRDVDAEPLVDASDKVLTTLCRCPNVTHLDISWPRSSLFGEGTLPRHLTSLTLKDTSFPAHKFFWCELALHFLALNTHVRLSTLNLSLANEGLLSQLLSFKEGLGELRVLILEEVLNGPIGLRALEELLVHTPNLETLHVGLAATAFTNDVDVTLSLPCLRVLRWNDRRGNGRLPTVHCEQLECLDMTGGTPHCAQSMVELARRNSKLKILGLHTILSLPYDDLEYQLAVEGIYESLEAGLWPALRSLSCYASVDRQGRIATALMEPRGRPLLSIIVGGVSAAQLEKLRGVYPLAHVANPFPRPLPKNAFVKVVVPL